MFQKAPRDLRQDKSLYNFFQRNLKQVFTDLNLKNQQTLIYIASILTYFARTEHLFRIKQIPKFKLESVIETLLQLEEAKLKEQPFAENEEILIRRHVGDYALFMSGVFREYVQKMGYLEFYHFEGSRSYHRVYDYAYQDYGPDATVFQDLSRQFENYSGALDYMKKVYFYYPEIDDNIQEMLSKLLS